MKGLPIAAPIMDEGHHPLLDGDSSGSINNKSQDATSIANDETPGSMHQRSVSNSGGFDSEAAHLLRPESLSQNGDSDRSTEHYYSRRNWIAYWILGLANNFVRF